MGNFILLIPGNLKDSLVISTLEITKDIASFFLLISTATHTGVNNDVINDAKYNDDGYDTMSDINESKSVKESVNDNLADE